MRIATRGSRLALWQAEFVRDLLVRQNPTLDIELVVIKTSGDKILDRPLSEVGGKALFVKEIEEALEAGSADLAVHSMKDVPWELPPRLVLGAMGARIAPRDALVARKDLRCHDLSDVPIGARIGTSSLRRSAQLLALRPDVRILPLRGNVDTRIRKLDEGEFDAIVLAWAGLERLAFAQRANFCFEETLMIPAVGQGALGLEHRKDDAVTAALCQGFEDPRTRLEVTAERALARRLEGNCKTPIAARATLSDSGLALHAMVASLDGRRVLRAAGTMQRAEVNPLGLGDRVADELVSQGALALLQSTHPSGGP